MFKDPKKVREKENECKKGGKRSGKSEGQKGGGRRRDAKKWSKVSKGCLTRKVKKVVPKKFFGKKGEKNQKYVTKRHTKCRKGVKARW